MNNQHVLDKRQSHPLDKKERQSIASKKWYKQNKEAITAKRIGYIETYYSNNKDKISTQKKEYYLLNKEIKKQKAHMYYHSKKEENWLFQIKI